MQWWMWFAIGTVLLGSELTFIDAQFYLVFFGASAFAVGVLQITFGMPEWLQWLLFALIAATSVIAFRRRIYERLRRKLPPLKAGPAGEIVTLPAELPPGATCRLEFRGSSWSAVNGGEGVIAAGGKARIQRVEGLTLVVHGET
jgi:membrane protein implicated in regulation of membrane protease activity